MIFIVLMGKDLVGGVVIGFGKIGVFVVFILECLFYCLKKIVIICVVIFILICELVI